MRLFVSVDLPDDLAPEIERIQNRVRDAGGLQFVDPAQAHITVKFLGDVDPDRVPEVEAALDRAVLDAGVDPFEATLGGLGVFPDLEYIRVLWIGVTSGADRLTALHESAEAELVELGFEPEEHAFTPHVTLARMEHAGGKSLVQRMVSEENPTVGSMRVADIRLTESTLTDSGPEYSTVTQVPL